MNRLEANQIMEWHRTKSRPLEHELIGSSSRSNFVKKAKKFTLKDDQLFKKGKRVLLDDEVDQVFEECHNHVGITNTWETIVDRYYWLGSWEEV